MNFKRTSILYAIFIIFFTAGMAFSQDLKSKIDEIISADSLSKTAIVAVKVVDEDSKTAYYQKNVSLLLHPASTMKVATSAMVLSTLGKNYKLQTALYEKNGVLYLKLSGDPTLTHYDMEKLFKRIQFIKYNSLVIDTSMIDNRFYDNGWMWNNLVSDDSVPYGIFNLDRNIIPVKIMPDKKTGMVQFSANYPLKLVNELKIGEQNDIKIEKRPWLIPDAIYFSGKIMAPCVENIPIQNPQEYFLHYLYKATPNFCGKTYWGETPSDAVFLASKETSLLQILSEQNKKSNNLFAQTMFKIAAHEAFGTTGTFDDGVKLFNRFYKNPGMVLSDASGLSHYDLLTCDFLCDVLCKMASDNIFRSTLAESGKAGTLHNRLKEVKLQGKTGTIAGVSGLCGYVKSKSGHRYVFAVLIQNYDGKASSAKNLEDKIVRIINEF